MSFNIPKVPETPTIDPALANKITEIINKVSLQIIEGTPPGEIEEDVIKGEIKKAVTKEIDPLLEDNESLVEEAEKLVDKGIEKAWEGIKGKMKEPEVSEEITPVDIAYCGKCGAKIDESWNVCQNCGVELDKSIYQIAESIPTPEIEEQPEIPQQTIEPSSTTPISQIITQERGESGPYALCASYSPLPSGASCKHYDERTYDCNNYGVEYCPLNKQIAKFRAKKEYLREILRKKVERRAFKPNEYYNDVFNREYMKKL